MLIRKVIIILTSIFCTVLILDLSIAYSDMNDFTAKFIEGARLEVSRRPIYKSSYHSGGYPPESIGVCTDLIWRAFMHAGVDLKKLVDQDISEYRSAYPMIITPDKNIDFRRVRNLLIFFNRNAEVHTTVYTKSKSEEWQPGDIITFRNPDHIAIISDKKNKDGYPYLIHNEGPFAMENDSFLRWYQNGVTGHFRYNK